MIHRDLPYSDAVWYAQKAEHDLRGHEFNVDTAAVLELTEQTGHSAYDCEYVALAQTRGLTIVTDDKALPRLFPNTAVLLEDFAAA